MPLGHMNRALELSKVFFKCPLEEKLKSSSVPGAPIPAGYNRKDKHSIDNNEFFLMFPPGSSHNVFPANSPGFREALEEIFAHFLKIGLIVESIISECLGLPPNLLKEYNNDRNWDLLAALFYTAATDNSNIGLGVSEHKDMSCITIVLQDEVGGLEVRKDGEWFPLAPVEGALVVNIGDVLQVLSNDKFKSPVHRVVRPKAGTRNSVAFFYNLAGDKFIEPLPQFTKEIGESPKYRQFLYKEYMQLRTKNKSDPPSQVEDEIGITHYAITT